MVKLEYEVTFELQLRFKPIAWLKQPYNIFTVIL